MIFVRDPGSARYITSFSGALACRDQYLPAIGVALVDHHDYGKCLNKKSYQSILKSIKRIMIQ